MRNVLSVYQNKYCKTTFLALPRLSYIIFNRPVVGKTTLSRQKWQKYIIITELQVNLQNISISVVTFSVKYQYGEKNCAARKNLTINFVLMINCDFLT